MTLGAEKSGCGASRASRAGGRAANAARAGGHARRAVAALAVAVVVVPLVAGGCAPGGEPGAAVAQESSPASGGERPPLLVRTAEVVLADLTRGVRATATLKSSRHEHISARTAGVVAEVLVEVGDRVEAGDTLVRLDPVRLELARDEAMLTAREAAERASDAALQVREAEAGLRNAALAREEAEANLKRVSDLFKKALVSEGDLDAARFAQKRAVVGVESAEIALERARFGASMAQALADKADLAKRRAALDLQHAAIRAPFAGVVTTRTAEPGQMLAEGVVVVELADPTRLEAEVFLPQKNLAELHPDMAVEVRADARPGRLGHGVIERLPRTVDPVTGTVRLVVVLADPKHAEPEAGAGAESLAPAGADAAAAQERSAAGLAQPAAARAQPQTAEDEDEVGAFLPGMFVTLRIVTERRDAVPVIPKKAMRLEGGRALVYAVEDGVVRAVRFDSGLEDGDRAEVTGGALAAGDRVVLVGVDQVEDGVRVQEAGAPADATPDGGEAGR